MKVVAHCPKCDAGLPVTAAEAPESIKCGRCGHLLALVYSESIRGDSRVDLCPVCRGADFYIRKDFDPKVGLTVVIIGALISAGFYWFGEDLIAYGILGGAALIDLLVCGRLGDVTVCYRCRSEFAGKSDRNCCRPRSHSKDVISRVRYADRSFNSRRSPSPASSRSRPHVYESAYARSRSK